MSTDTSDTTGANSATDYTESELRERFQEVVQGKSKRSKSIHIPDPGADDDDPQPMCDRHTSGDWIRKDTDVFPPGWCSWCQSCKKRLRDKEQVVEPDGFGDALASDWG